MSNRVLAVWITGLLLGGTVAAAGDVRLIDAVRNGDLASVEALLDNKANVNEAQPDGATALHWAVNAEDLRLTKLLLSAGANVHAANDYGVTPLSIAAGARRAELVEALLAAGANPHAALPTGETAVMTAARNGSLGTVTALLARGANPNAHEHVMGQTALMWAIAEHHSEVAEALLAKGADVRARSNGGATPLMFAARAGRDELVWRLVEQGADVNDADKEGYTALHIAVMRGYPGIARYLLARGADPNAAASGYTALHWASGTFETIHSHDYIFNETAVNRVQEWAVLAGILDPQEKHDMIAALLAHGADINARTTKRIPELGFSLFRDADLIGATPLFLASITADVATMRFLIANGADAAVPNKDGTTPLIMAAGMGYVPQETRVPEDRIVEAVKLLLDIGSNVNEQNAAGYAALHATAMWERHKVLRYLLERGANINIKTRKGDTPLKLARDGFEHNVVYHYRPETAKLLKELGASDE